AARAVGIRSSAAGDNRGMSEPSFAPGRRIGGYLLADALGEGAGGLVFRARTPGGGTVAVKVLRPDRAADDVLRARFTRVARPASPRRVSSSGRRTTSLPS